jgi:hypothetical protein
LSNALAADIGTGIATVLGDNAAFATWEFHEGLCEDPSELAERNQNIAAVQIEGWDDLEVYESSAKTEYRYKVTLYVFDRADADSNTGPLVGAIQSTLGERGTILYAAISDSGSNLLDGVVTPKISAVNFDRADASPASKTTQRTVQFNISVTCWRSQPQA